MQIVMARPNTTLGGVMEGQTLTFQRGDTSPERERYTHRHTHGQGGERGEIILRRQCSEIHTHTGTKGNHLGGRQVQTHKHTHTHTREQSEII